MVTFLKKKTVFCTTLRTPPPALVRSPPGRPRAPLGDGGERREGGGDEVGAPGPGREHPTAARRCPHHGEAANARPAQRAGDGGPAKRRKFRGQDIGTPGVGVRWRVAGCWKAPFQCRAGGQPPEKGPPQTPQLEKEFLPAAPEREDILRGKHSP